MMSVKSFLRLYCFLFASFGFSPEAKRELGQENQARLDAEAHGVEVEKKKKKKKTKEEKREKKIFLILWAALRFLKSMMRL